MMKSFLPILVFATLVVSCGTSNKYMADDIYVLKPSELAIGESSADETSYSAFKKRKQGAVSDQQVYADQQAQIRYTNCLNMISWQSNCGCSYSQWAAQSPYSNSLLRNQYYGPNNYSYGQQYAMMGWNNPYGNSFGNPYYGGNPYMYSTYGPYNSYNNMYYNMYGYHNNYYGYGYGFGGYGYNGNVYSGTGNSSSGGSNVYNGPRGTSSGYANPSGRHYTGTVNSPKAPDSHSNGTFTKNTTSRQTISKPISEINNNPASFDRSGSARSTTGRVVAPSSSGSHQYATTSRATVFSTGTTRSSGTTINRTSPTQGTPQRSVERPISTPTQTRSSGGSINSGSSSGGSSGGSRSSGSSSSGGGARRP